MVSRTEIVERLNSGEINIRNVLSFPAFSNLKKCHANRIWAMCTLRGCVKRCVVCRAEFKPERRDSKALTCCKSCSAIFREARKREKLAYRTYRNRQEAYRQLGYDM